MNILKKEDNSVATTFGHNRGVTKRGLFSWASDSRPGSFRMIPKTKLNIDGDYQREQVSEAKVIDIAAHWDWRLFGALSVVQREDESFWVIDGGHRGRASFRRDDVTKLPCMVFTCESIKDEAKAFMGTNTFVSTVSAFNKHRAALLAGEPQALAVQALLEKHGYRASSGSAASYTFSALNTLRRVLRENAELAEEAFALCVEATDAGGTIHGEVILGLFTCAKKLEAKTNVFEGVNRDKLIAAGVTGILINIRREKHIVGRGGSLVAAKAILDLLNKGKQRRLSFD